MHAYYLAQASLLAKLSKALLGHLIQEVAHTSGCQSDSGGLVVKALAIHTGDLSSIPGLGGIFFLFFPFFFCCRWGTLLGSRDSTVMGGGKKGKTI